MVSSAKQIANSDMVSFVGGGNTRDSIKSLGLYDKFSFVSTGGGAMLGYIAYGSLPGIDAL